MKVRVNVELDLDSGEYDLQVFSLEKDKKKIDQQKLASMLQKVVKSWNQRFTN
jgi:hypothetical protein